MSKQIRFYGFICGCLEFRLVNFSQFFLQYIKLVGMRKKKLIKIALENDLQRSIYYVMKY